MDTNKLKNISKDDVSKAIIYFVKYHIKQEYRKFYCKRTP